MAHGLAPETPAAVIRWGTRGRAADASSARSRRSPTSAAAARPAAAGHRRRRRRSCGCATRSRWFERKPLFGRRIVVTRPRAQAAGFIDALDAPPAPRCCRARRSRSCRRRRGRRSTPPSRRLESYDWVVLTSVNGVRDVLRAPARAAPRRARPAPRPRRGGRARDGAPRSQARGVLVDVVPEEFRAEGGRRGAWRRPASPAQRVLLPRAAAAREILPAMLRERRCATSTRSPRYADGRAARAIVAELRDLLGAASDRPGHLHQLEHRAQLRRRCSAAMPTICCAGTRSAASARSPPTPRAQLGLASRSAATLHDPGIHRRDRRALRTIDDHGWLADPARRGVPSAGRPRSQKLARGRWSFPTYRPRRLRRNETLAAHGARDAAQRRQLILPLFVVPGTRVEQSGRRRCRASRSCRSTAPSRSAGRCATSAFRR